jgi:hypothetical protein
MVHTLFDLTRTTDLAGDVRRGLLKPGQKELPSKYFETCRTGWRRRSPSTVSSWLMRLGNSRSIKSFTTAW